jgi:serine/threonine protein kinase
MADQAEHDVTRIVFPRPVEPRDPHQLGEYTVSQVLGEGGMGRVYLGLSPSGRQVAIKVIRPELADQPEFVERFREEAANAQRVHRLHSAQVLGFDAVHRPPYLVIEYVDGPTLSQRIRLHGRMAGSELDQLAFVTANALAAIHEAGLVHRDVKPSNIILSATGPRVIDFGVAAETDPAFGTARGRTRVGTRGFGAPEQLLGQGSTAKSDVFSWAATITFAGTGRMPFDEGGYRILEEEMDLRLLDPPLRSVVAQALRLDPRERPTARKALGMLAGADPVGGIASGSARDDDRMKQEILRRMGF